MSRLTIRVHERHYTSEGGVMERYYGILSNGHSPMMLEKMNTSTLFKRHGQHGFGIITANRSDRDADYNERKTKELIADLKKSGYRYLPVYGGYVGDDGVEGDYEPSFIVFPYSTQSKEFTDFAPFKDFLLDLCGKYIQNSVLITEPEGNPNYYNAKGDKVNSDSSRKLILNDPKQMFFTSFKDKDAVDAEVTAKLKPLYRKYAKEHPEVPFDEFKNFSRDKLKSIGRRFTMDIKFGESFQLFLNPNPTTLNEKMQRMKSGEILFCELAKD